jgi:mRNA (guanine-N7-)-methyltransferase
VKRLRNSDSNSFGNEVYKITFHVDDKSNLPLFGCKYDFFLEGVVNCPEFLVYFPLLEQLAKEHGLRLVKKRSFAQAFGEMISQSDNRALIGKMQGLEPYPPDEDIELMCKDKAAYKIAKAAVAGMEAEQVDNTGHHRRSVKVGTLSAPEWEAANVYLLFIFEKVDSTGSTDPVAGSDSSNSDSAGQHKRHVEHDSDVEEAKRPRVS